MKGTTQVVESDLLLFCISPSLPLSFGCLSESNSASLVAEVSDLMIYSRGAGITELRFRIKEIRTGEGLARFQRLMGLSVRETSGALYLSHSDLCPPWEQHSVVTDHALIHFSESLRS